MDRTRARAWSCILLGALSLAACARPRVTIGSKKFTESVLLAEIAAQLLRSTGIPAEHQRELGGTRALWDALRAGRIDAYPEYTGTLRAELFPKQADRDLAGLLAEHGIAMTAPLGFSNSYAIGIREDVAKELGIWSLSDLAAHREVVLGLSPEFLDRADGWLGLRDTYGLGNATLRLEHDVVYRALDRNAVGAIDLYSTDAEIVHRKLRVLVDDRHYFPNYEAVLLLRRGLPDAVGRTLARLAGSVSESRMIALNARVMFDHRTESAVGAELLAERFGIDTPGPDAPLWRRLATRSAEHLFLVLLSLVAAILIGVPLGALAARRRLSGEVGLGVVALAQVVPPLALLVLMIPLLGIGRAAALAAMFVYGLFPIARGTVHGLTEIPSSVREEARALTRWARLRSVELPLAAPSILAGIRTSAVLGVGMATLAALFGAGGHGQPILAGLRLDDRALLLEGALPAIVLALLVHAVLGLLERRGR